MPLLGSQELGGAQASMTVDLPRRYKYLFIGARVSGYSASGIASFQFNRDTGANYADRVMVSTSVTNVTTVATTRIRVASVAITGVRSLIWAIVRKTTTGVAAAVIGHTHSDQEGLATAPLMYWFSGTWANTTDFITSVTLTSTAGNLNAATRLAVWGTDDV